jgi:hypothetical protein
MAEYQYVTCGMNDGAIIAKSDGKVGFFDTTPTTQPVAPVAAVTAGATTTVCNTAVAEIQVALQALGILDT